jgi:hypothetical protein
MRSNLVEPLNVLNHLSPTDCILLIFLVLISQHFSV